MNDSSLQKALNRLLSGELEDFVRSRRPHVSWRDIAAELSTATNATVAHETIRRWYPDPARADAA